MRYIKIHDILIMTIVKKIPSTNRYVLASRLRYYATLLENGSDPIGVAKKLRVMAGKVSGRIS